MKYRIYVDVLFANNFFIHLCLLFLLNKLLKCTATHLSVILGSLIGTIGSCLVLFLPGISPYIKVFIVYSGVCLLMVKFGLRIKSFYTLIKATIYFYLLSFVFGGILDWIFLMIPSLEEYRF